MASAQRIVNLKQSCIPEGAAENWTFKDLASAGAVVPITAPPNLPTSSVGKTDGSWRMTAGCQKLSHVVL